MTIEEYYNRELNEWASTITFYLGETDILKNRLTEVAAKNNKPSINAQVEHFENQFVVQKNSLQLLQHKMRIQMDRLAAEVKAGTGLNNLDIVDEQHFLRESVHLAEKIFIELKHSFYRFLAKVF
jgi:hypothetical protein